MASRGVQFFLVLACAVSYFSYVFGLLAGTPFRSGLGDWVDPYFINGLLEHWHHSFWNLTDPSSPSTYFPVRGTLGYSHGLILYAPIYVAVRPFLHPFQAHNLTLFLVLVGGAQCLYVILRRFIQLSFVESLLLSVFFFSSANLINGGTEAWSQRASVFLVPPVLLMAWGAARMHRGSMRIGLSCLSGLLGSLLLTQDFYTAALAALVAALFLAGAVLVAPGLANRESERADRTSHPSSMWWVVVGALSLAWAIAIQVHPIVRTTIGPIRISATDPTRPLLLAVLALGWCVCRKADLAGRIAKSWQQDRSYLLAFLTGTFMGSVVFLWTYLGIYNQRGAFPDDQLINSLTAVDLSSTPWTTFSRYDTLRSFTLVFVVASLAWVPRFRVGRSERLWCLWFLVVSSVVLLIPLRLNELSIWRILFAHLPALATIRDPKRIIETYELAVALLTALFLTRLPARSPLRLAVSALVLLLLLTNWNPNVFGFWRPMSVYARWVEAPIDIDRSCESFFIKKASDAYMSRSGHKWSLYGVDSMFVSLNHSIPTLNGYSAWSPDGWGLANPQNDDYGQAVDQWIASHGLHGVCEFDIEDRTMRPSSAPQ